MTQKYILNAQGEPVSEYNPHTWARWFETAERQVAKSLIGVSSVSTVFLGLDHSYGDAGPPVLWETMVFGGPLNQEQDRCSGSREQAQAMHARMVERVSAALPA
jgi:hypothetical protein